MWCNLGHNCMLSPLSLHSVRNPVFLTTRLFPILLGVGGGGCKTSITASVPRMYVLGCMWVDKTREGNLRRQHDREQMVVQVRYRRYITYLLRWFSLFPNSTFLSLQGLRTESLWGIPFLETVELTPLMYSSNAVFSSSSHRFPCWCILFQILDKSHAVIFL